MKILIYGLITGMLFGFLLQKGRVLRYDRQVGAMLFKDMTIFKFMLSAIFVAMAGVYLLKDLGVVELHFKPTLLGANIIGGLIFGAGWGLLGYCPGTALGALGEGRWDALSGVAGMLCGAALFAEVYPAMSRTVLTWGNYGHITLPQVLGLNHWVVIIIFISAGIAIFKLFERKGI